MNLQENSDVKRFLVTVRPGPEIDWRGEEIRAKVGQDTYVDIVRRDDQTQA